MVGTPMSNRTGILKEVKDRNNCENLSTNIYWGDNNDTVLSSYVVKTKSGKKCFVISNCANLTWYNKE